MKRALTVFLLVASLFAIAQSADIIVNVGGPKGEYIFEPATVMAALGDNIVFTLVSGTHTVIESDAKGDCIKSAKPKRFDSVFDLINAKKFTVPMLETGKTWFYCSVADHCKSGMYGTIIVSDAGAPPAKVPPPAGGAPASPSASGASVMPSISAAGYPSASFNPFPTVYTRSNKKDAAIIGTSVSLGIICTVLLFTFFYRYKRKKTFAQRNTTANAGAEYIETGNNIGLTNKTYPGAEFIETEKNIGPTNRNETEAQEVVVDENDKVLDELQKEIIILERQKRIAELKKEIKHLEA